MKSSGGQVVKEIGERDIWGRGLSINSFIPQIFIEHVQYQALF